MTSRPVSAASPASVDALPGAASPSVSAVTALLERSAWFAGAPEALRASLRAAGRVRTLCAGERLFLRGDPADGIYCVLEGAMRVGAASAAGREALLAVVGPAQWFGEIALFDAGVRTHDAYAERDAMLFHVPRAALAALLDATPAWWHAFGLLLAQKLRLAFDAIEENALLPAAPRVARRLLLLATGYGQAGRESGHDVAHKMGVVRVPQEDLALMLALSRQTVNQILRQFERDGLVALRYGEIEIVDAARLEQHAQ
ncbi:Crp/Fnr family transcriptional regulator [Paraburkholderia silviterrae]|uniref:Crp/Fnr family transcriptional regulator n=1 Tax=Paraburkholderia silviterrae TaxID=2528715 RepID=A0A4R5M6H8_9BURK|nr:Crp/Fnr family transcriptional regulator [Paraburkholderia silviterrae]TDG21580.1 Crp/Fnr family transcriptional regulator [Paraburkholderia silviterrae]